MEESHTLAPPPINFEEETIHVRGKWIRITVKGNPKNDVEVSMEEVASPPPAWAIRPALLGCLMLGGIIIWVLIFWKIGVFRWIGKWFE